MYSTLSISALILLQPPTYEAEKWVLTPHATIIAILLVRRVARGRQRVAAVQVDVYAARVGGLFAADGARGWYVDEAAVRVEAG